MRAPKLLLLVIFLQSVVEVRRFDSSNSRESAAMEVLVGIGQRLGSASMPVDCHLDLAQCKKRLLFCVNVVSNKSAE